MPGEKIASPREKIFHYSLLCSQLPPNEWLKQEPWTYLTILWICWVQLVVLWLRKLPAGISHVWPGLECPRWIYPVSEEAGRGLELFLQLNGHTLHTVTQGSRERKIKSLNSLLSKSRTNAAWLLQHMIGQSNSQGHPGFKGKGNRLYLLQGWEQFSQNHLWNTIYHRQQE